MKSLHRVAIVAALVVGLGGGFGAGYAWTKHRSTAAHGLESERVRAAVKANSQGQVEVAEVRPTPVDGLYEVLTSERDIFYVDGTGRYGLAEARLVDMQQRKDLTSARLDALNRIDFKTLPLHLAIKYGSGPKVLAIFEDATCPVCKPLHKFLMQVPDTTVYVFPYPVVSKDSMPIAGTTWCSDDRARTWQEAMGGDIEINRAPRCDLAGLKEILDLGERLALKGTPTIFLANGQRLQGAVPPDQLIAALDASMRDVAGPGQDGKP